MGKPAAEPRDQALEQTNSRARERCDYQSIIRCRKPMLSGCIPAVRSVARQKSLCVTPLPEQSRLVLSIGNGPTEWIGRSGARAFGARLRPNEPRERRCG